MDYEQKYKEALEKAKKVHKYSSDIAEIKRMEEIFPELAESADEKIRKMIINQMEGWHKAALENNAVQDIKESAWKPADGDDLPEIDREVIALLEDGKVVFAHRPPEYWDGKNIITGEITRYYPKRYDGGGWNQPNVKWWLDLELPKMED